MSKCNTRELEEELQRRIACLVTIQNSLLAALNEPCGRDKRKATEGSLRRHRVKEEKARQELAALG
jgi:hypothetical protein